MTGSNPAKGRIIQILIKLTYTNFTCAIAQKRINMNNDRVKKKEELDLLTLFAVDHETRQYFKENFNKKLAQLEEVTK